MTSEGAFRLEARRNARETGAASRKKEIKMEEAGPQDLAALRFGRVEFDPGKLDDRLGMMPVLEERVFDGLGAIDE